MISPPSSTVRSCRHACPIDVLVSVVVFFGHVHQFYGYVATHPPTPPLSSGDLRPRRHGSGCLGLPSPYQRSSDKRRITQFAFRSSLLPIPPTIPKMSKPKGAAKVLSAAAGSTKAPPSPTAPPATQDSTTVPRAPARAAASPTSPAPRAATSPTAAPKPEKPPKAVAKASSPDGAPPRHHIAAFIQFTTYCSYAILMFFGYVRDFVERLSRKRDPDYAPLVRDWDDFFTRRLYYRVRDCWNRPVNTRAGRVIGVMERVSKDFNYTFEFTGRTIPCINLASYNYLGFSEDVPAVTEQVLANLDQFGVAACASPAECGRSTTLTELETEIARFAGKEAACVYAMGFVTNFSGLPGLFDKETLVISDSLNHASLVAGVRVSDGRVKVFPHNNMRALERIIRQAIIEGQPRTHRAWARLVIVVEGIYSMEGDILDLAPIIALKKKYRCLLYIDEAHSIGAIGATGRGVCDYRGVDPRDVDILMGTFTKSFGSIGGYIACDKRVADHLRTHCGASIHGDSLHSAACQQALSALRIMQGLDGTTIGRQRIAQLADNAKYFREQLIRLGMTVYGEGESPVIPAMLYNPAKVSKFSRELLKRNVAVVVVGYPATPLLEARVRFCVSAAHTRADLDRCLQAIDEAIGEACVRFERKWWFV